MHPQGKSCSWGKTEADGASTVRCTSTEPANPRHPITTHTPIAFTWLRPGQTNRNPEASAIKTTETSCKAAPAPLDAKANHKGQIESRKGGHHTMPREHLPQPLHYDLHVALRTREASVRPLAWGSVPTIVHEGLTPCRVMLWRCLHTKIACAQAVHKACAIGLSGHGDRSSLSQHCIHCHCPSRKASNHAQGGQGSNPAPAL